MKVLIKVKGEKVVHDGYGSQRSEPHTAELEVEVDDVSAILDQIEPFVVNSVGFGMQMPRAREYEERCGNLEHDKRELEKKLRAVERAADKAGEEGARFRNQLEEAATIGIDLIVRLENHDGRRLPRALTRARLEELRKKLESYR